MQPATAALGWTGTAGHLTLSGPLIEARREKYPPSLIPWLLQVVLARPPNRFSFIQGSSADVIQLPGILLSRSAESHLNVLSLVRPPGGSF